MKKIIERVKNNIEENVDVEGFAECQYCDAKCAFGCDQYCKFACGCVWNKYDGVDG